MASWRSLAASAAFVPLLLGAQAERVTIRLAPVPGQTFRTRLVQATDLIMETEDQGDAAAPRPPTRFNGTITFVATIVVGARDDAGRVEARLTYDEVTADLGLNGGPQRKETPVDLQGRQLTLVYDRDGQIVDVTSNLSPNVADAFKPALTSIFGAMAPMTLAVGESATRPMAVSLPLPGAERPGGLSSTTRFTLTSVTADGGEPVAHLSTAMTAEMNPPPTAPGGSNTSNMSMTMRIDGTGTMDVNVERGIVVKGAQTVTVDGRFRAAAAGAAPAMRIHGTMTMSQASEPQP